MGSRKYDLYGPEESKEEKIRYEVIKLPFQDQVRTVRGVVVGIWKNIKVNLMAIIISYLTGLIMIFPIA